MVSVAAASLLWFRMAEASPSFALAIASAAGESVPISEWLVPWSRSEPRDPFVDSAGRVWFAGQRGNFIANLQPETGDFSRYDLPDGTSPQGLLVSADGIIWFAAWGDRHIGRLDPRLGRVTRIDLPDRGARDPHTLAFDADGNIWFTVERGNVIGRLELPTLRVRLLELPSRKLRPAGIAVDSRGEPWAAATDDNVLLRVDAANMTVAEIELPEKKSRPYRVALTSDDRVWYTDHERGMLGGYDPGSGLFLEWELPGGEDSKPIALTADRLDRLWLVETGREPNRLVGFDAASGQFFSLTEIPSGGERVHSLHYFEPAGELWFGTSTNYVGRAGIH